MRLRISQDMISEILSPVVCPLQYTPRQSSGIPLGEATYSSYIPQINLLCSRENVINDGYVPKSAQQNSINSLSRRASPAWSFPGVEELGWVRSPWKEEASSLVWGGSGSNSSDPLAPVAVVEEDSGL